MMTKYTFSNLLTCIEKQLCCMIQWLIPSLEEFMSQLWSHMSWRICGLEIWLPWSGGMSKFPIFLKVKNIQRVFLILIYSDIFGWIIEFVTRRCKISYILPTKWMCLKHLFLHFLNDLVPTILNPGSSFTTEIIFS